MKVQILGSGCENCQTLEANAEKAIGLLGIDADIEKITDSDEIADMGVMLTPALAVDGAVKSSGKVLAAEDIIELLRNP